MAEVVHEFPAWSGEFRATGFPALVRANGSNYPVPGLAFDAAAVEAVFFFLRAAKYGSGTISVDIDWYADTASTNAVVWGAQLAAITPGTDTQDIETDTLATAATTTTSHAGTTAQRLHRTTVTITALDSLAADDLLVLRVYRDAAIGADTMTGDAIAVLVTVRYSDS
ncbi:MAG: hypothetical protein ACRDUA_17210 [Micromonosporaceae bacterium]